MLGKINLEEIECSEPEWNEIIDQLRNGWSSLENDLRFAFKTADKEITEDDIKEIEDNTRYFGVSIIIYESEIV